MKLLIAFLMSTALCLSFVQAAGPDADDGSNSDSNYDHLDGTGRSGKTVNVIEWEGNLEIQVSPGGSLKGLGLTIDAKNKDKKVMVIAYRFEAPPSLTRRAILSIPLTEPFNVYRDSSAGDYDKIVITNATLKDKNFTPFKLDAKPTVLYPEGHPAISPPATGSPAPASPAAASAPAQKQPAGGDKGLGTFGY